MVNMNYKKTVKNMERIEFLQHWESGDIKIQNTKETSESLS